MWFLGLSFWRSPMCVLPRDVCAYPSLGFDRACWTHCGTVCEGFFVIPISCDLVVTPSRTVRPEAILFWGRDGPTSLCLLLSVVADRVESTWVHEICWEFARWFEVALPCVVVLATCCSTHIPSIVDLSLELVELARAPFSPTVAWWCGRLDWSPPPFLQASLVDLPYRQGQSQCVWAPSIFWASGEDLRPKFDLDFQMVDFGSSFGNESSSALWLTFMTNTRLVRLLDCDLTCSSSTAKLLTCDFDCQRQQVVKVQKWQRICERWQSKCI